MKFIIISLFLCVLLSSSSPVEKQTATVYYKDGKYSIVSGKLDIENGLCFATFDPLYDTKGWDILIMNSTIHSSEYSDSEILYCVGYLEGYLLNQRIWIYYESVASLSFFQSNGTMPQFAIDFLEAQKEWVLKNSNKTVNDPYFDLAKNSYEQLNGMMDGYNDAVGVNDDEKKLSYWDMYLVFSMGDMMNILALGPKTREFTDEEVGNGKLFREYSKGSHCSAFITYDKSNDDIYFAHTTWALYSFQVRVFKMFTVYLNNPLKRAKTVYFSSYPGAAISTDDFYVTTMAGSSGDGADEINLMVMETTLSCYNDSLSKLIVPQSMLIWQRIIISNWFSESSTDWAMFFGKYNSGTYNNEWLVLSGKKVKSRMENKYRSFQENSLIVLDQIPGFIDYDDVTDQLNEKYYFSSYNVPYSDSVYAKCEIAEYIKKHPDEKYSLDYQHCTRANIFRRDAANVGCVKDAMKLIRYNNYTEDPLTMNNPSDSICARQDLNDPNPFCSGGIDGKVISFKDFSSDGIINIISSPTYEDTSVFKYSDAQCCNMPFTKHPGQPDVWNFPWMKVGINRNQ